MKRRRVQRDVLHAAELHGGLSSAAPAAAGSGHMEIKVGEINVRVDRGLWSLLNSLWRSLSQLDLIWVDSAGLRGAKRLLKCRKTFIWGTCYSVVCSPAFSVYFMHSDY